MMQHHSLAELVNEMSAALDKEAYGKALAILTEAMLPLRLSPLESERQRVIATYGEFRGFCEKMQRQMPRNPITDARAYLYVKLMVLYTHLRMLARWCITDTSDPHWVNLVEHDFTAYIEDLQRAVHQRTVQHTPACERYLATFFYASLIEYSEGGKAAQQFPQWNEAGTDLGKMLRYHYEISLTRLRWETAFGPGGLKRMNLGSRTRAYVQWLGRRLYGAVAAYGIHGGAFVRTTALVIFVFSSVYGITDHLTGCAHGTTLWQYVLWSISAGLANFTTVGSVVPGCSIVFAPATAIESVCGYFMLGLLVSLLWQTFMPQTTSPLLIHRLEGEEIPHA